jgi:hypothetical protein
LGLPYEVSQQNELKMTPFILREMLQHLAFRLASTATLVGLLNKKESEIKYDMKLIGQKERTLMLNAVLLGVAFGAIAIWLVFYVKGDDGNVMIMVAGILLSLGLMQQIISIALDAVTTSLSRFLSTWNSVINLLAKQKMTPEWRLVQDETEELFIFPQLLYSLPSGISKTDPQASDKTVSYIAEHRWELAYPQANFSSDEKSLLSFAKYAIDFLRERLEVYDRISTIQYRTGTVNPVVFVALGTLIWLLS